jgi:hypothetical protein
MFKIRRIEKWRGHAACSVAAILFGSMMATGAALAQDRKTGGPTPPSRSGAEVYFVNLKDGAEVPSN